MSVLDPSIVPDIHRAHRSGLLQWLARKTFKLMGWQMVGRIADDRHMLMVIAPHTSNWDFIVGILALWGMDFKCKWMAKNSLFKWPLGSIMRAWGGISIDRQNPSQIADNIAATIKSSDVMAIAITPEGTRSKVENWKTGFLRIAKAAECRMQLASIDFAKKTVVLGDVLVPGEDNEQQIRDIRHYFSQFTPKNPENF